MLWLSVFQVLAKVDRALQAADPENTFCIVPRHLGAEGQCARGDEELVERVPPLGFSFEVADKDATTGGIDFHNFMTHEDVNSLLGFELLRGSCYERVCVIDGPADEVGDASGGVGSMGPLFEYGNLHFRCMPLSL